MNAFAPLVFWGWERGGRCGANRRGAWLAGRQGESASGLSSASPTMEPHQGCSRQCSRGLATGAAPVLTKLLAQRHGQDGHVLSHEVIKAAAGGVGCPRFQYRGMRENDNVTSISGPMRDAAGALNPVSKCLLPSPQRHAAHLDLAGTVELPSQSAPCAGSLRTLRAVAAAGQPQGCWALPQASRR